MTPEQLVATVDRPNSWSDCHPTCNRVHVLKWRTHDRFCGYFSCSVQKRGIDSGIGGSFCTSQQLMLKLHPSISHVTMTTQLRTPAMPWKPGKDITPEEIWSGIESVEPLCARQQLPCSVLKASVVFRTFGATSSFLQPNMA